MNFCDERHELKYEITYKPAKGSNFSPIWYVCDACYENKRCFGSDDEIESRKLLA